MVNAAGSSSAQPHVALFAFPFGTHVAPLHLLTRALAAATPAAIFSFVSTAETLDSLPRASGNIHLCPFEEEITDDRSSAGIVERIGGFLEAAPGKIRAAVKAAAEDAGGIPVSCVVSDAFMWAAASVAEEMGVPWVTVFTGFPLAMLAHMHTDDLRRHFGTEEKAILPAHADELLDFIPGLATMRVRDLPEGIIFGDPKSSFALHLHGMAQRLPLAAAVILPTFAGLDLESTLRSKVKLTLPIGPFNLHSPPSPSPDKEDCLPWLDSQAASSVAYVAFGTVSRLPPAELAELAHGLEDSGVSFLWSLKEEARSGLPEGFVERTRLRGKLVSWAPQVSVLSHAAVGVFVTHSGWNSTLESISAGVVMLCRPIFADQRMVARAVESMLRVGANLDGGITREAFAGAIDEVLKGDEGKMMKERVVELRERTKKAVLNGGSFSENFKILVELVCRS